MSDLPDHDRWKLATPPEYGDDDPRDETPRCEACGRPLSWEQLEAAVVWNRPVPDLCAKCARRT